MMNNSRHIHEIGKINIGIVIKAARVLYCSILIYAEILYGIVNYNILFRENPAYMYNMIPGRTIAEYITKIQNSGINTDTVILLLIKNLFLFIPFRFVIGDLIKDEKKSFFWAAFFSAVLELIQMIAKIGVFDVDDIILNITGYLLGMILYKFVSQKRKEIS
ncbi:MAG: VanZ family protein [Clostridiales bacterium]|nr:VanZ family protein [Clostridiales bacterium]